MRFSNTDKLRFKAESSDAFALRASMHEAKPSETMIGYLILVLYSIHGVKILGSGGVSPSDLEDRL